MVVRAATTRTTPRVTQGAVHLGDRKLAFMSVGDPAGPLVLHNHGGPSSRLEANLLDFAADDNGLNLVCVDRPGQGKSDPQVDRSVASWAADLEAVADAFDADQFAVTGWSEGGLWALAAAAYIPQERLVHVSSIAPGGGRMDLHFAPDLTLMYQLLGLTRDAFATQFRNAMWPSACSADRDFLDDQRLGAEFMTAAHECFRQGSDGLMLDAKLINERWPFEIEQITRPVHFWQGSEDCLMSPQINRQIAARMPAGIWHEVVGAGHFVAITSASDILALAANDFAKLPAQR